MKKAVLVLAALLLGILIIAIGPRLAGGTPDTAADAAPGAGPTPATVAATRSDGQATSLASERVELPAEQSLPSTPAPGTTGALRVRVVRRGDGAPVQRASVVVAPQRGDVDAHADAQRGLTGVDGTLPVRGLAPGVAAVHVSGGDDQRATIDADRTTELVVQVQPGIAVRGRVTFADGSGAGGAAIVVGDSFDGVDAVTATDAAGDFALGEVYRYHNVGAVLAGYAPTPLQSLRPERAIELVLTGPAAVLAGTVVDDRERPVAGARVAAARHQEPVQWRDPRGFQLELAAAQVARTDAQGAFRFEVEPGSTALSVLAAGLAPYAEIVDAAIGGAPLRLQLQRGQELRGRVVDQQGTAVAGARVQLGGSAGVLRVTGEDGTFVYRAVRAGRVAVRVEGDDIEPFQGERDGAATGEWAIAVERRPLYKLQLLDEHGGALASWRVR